MGGGSSAVLADLEAMVEEHKGTREGELLTDLYITVNEYCGSRATSSEVQSSLRRLKAWRDLYEEAKTIVETVTGLSLATV